MESRSHATSEFILPGPPPTTLMTRPFHQHGPCRELWPSHHYCELVYTLDGGARLAIDGNTHEAGPGRVFLIKAKRPHSTIVADNRHFHGIVIHFVPNSLAAYVERIDSESLAQWEDVPSRTVGRLFERCLQENMELRTGAYQVSDALLNIILVECVRITGSSDPYNCGADDFSDSIKRISSACSAYIGEHYHEQLTLTKVASAHSHEAVRTHFRVLAYRAGLPEIAVRANLHETGQGDTAGHDGPVIDNVVVVDDASTKAEYIIADGSV